MTRQDGDRALTHLRAALAILEQAHVGLFLLTQLQWVIRVTEKVNGVQR